MPTPAAVLLLAGVVVLGAVITAIVLVTRQLTSASQAIGQLARRLAEAEGRSERLRDELVRTNDAIQAVRDAQALGRPEAPSDHVDVDRPHAATHHG